MVFKKGNQLWKMRKPHTVWNKGKKCPQLSGDKNGFFGKHHTKDIKKLIKQKALEQFKDGMPKKTKDKISKILKKRYENKENRERLLFTTLQGLMKRPTSFEKKISELCIENSLPFIYTGDGRFLINFKNPDFVNHQDKVVIEVFYSWFKIRDYGSVENYKEYCRKKYNPKGWKVIFIDENEVNVDNWKELCLNRILQYGRTQQ